MKPILTFVLGAILASGVAMYVMKPDPPATAEAPMVPATVQTAPVPAPLHEAEVPQANRPSRNEVASARRQEARPSRPARANQPSSSVGSSTSTLSPASPANDSAPASNSSSPSGPPQTTLSVPPPPEAKPAPPPRIAKTVTIPAGTLVSVRVDEGLSTKTSQVGDSFRATLDQPIVVDGAVVAEKGARVEGRIADADAGGRVKGSASLGLELVRLTTSDGQRVRLQTESFTKVAPRSTKKDAMKVGIGAGLGAAIGAIAGGGRGAAIGAGAGGAAGTGAVIATRGDAAEIPAETRVSFRLQSAITITEKLN